MAVPKFYEFMRPLLQFCSDGAEHTLNEAIEVLSKELNISDADQRLMLPSGTMTVVKNRVGWARTYLAKAKLLDAPRRGIFKIAPMGYEVLKEDIEVIRPAYLQKFESFREFQNINNENEEKETTSEIEDAATPEEIIADATAKLNRELSKELIKKILECSSQFFEQLVVTMLINLGYGGSRKEAGEAFQTSGDGGVDGVINEDRLGLEQIYVQAKRWQTENTVGRPDIQKFAGALQGVRAKKGIFITTSQFSRDAHEFVKQIDTKIILIDGEKLAQLMIETNTGVTLESKVEIKRIDLDFFLDGE